MTIRGEGEARIGSKLLWFAGIWLASVLALGAVAYAIKLVI